MGEERGAKRAYSNGLALGMFPLPVLIGEAANLAMGSPFPETPVTRGLSTGFDSRCYLATPPVPPVIVAKLDSRNCHFQHALIRILELQYQGTGSLAVAELSARYPTATITSVPNTISRFPGTIIAEVGNTSLVVISGTTNYLQWALQAVGGAYGLYNAGLFSTLLLWYEASFVVTNRISASSGSDSNNVVLVGHSYGGALASIVAARMRLANPDRNIQLLTFGSPRPGDVRLCEILSTVTQTHIINDADPVPWLPLGSPDIDLFTFLLPSPIYDRWVAWRHPSGRVGFHPDGTRYDSPQITPAYPYLYQAVLDIVRGTIPSSFSAHETGEYRRRCVCPGQVAPSPVPETDTGNGGTLAGGAADVYITAHYIRAGSGGTKAGGTADRQVERTGSGGTLAGGAAIAGRMVVYVADGGTLAGGVADQGDGLLVTGSGGTKAGSTADAIIDWHYYPVGSGGTKAGGTADYGRGWLGSGGTLAGGTADVYDGYPYLCYIDTGFPHLQLYDTATSHPGINVGSLATHPLIPDGTTVTAFVDGYQAHITLSAGTTGGTVDYVRFYGP